MPTTNPVPSTDPSDLLFNAGKLDEVVNGNANSFTDRLGVARRTVAGMNADFDAQLADAESDLNVYRADAAASAAEALGYLQTIRATSYGAYASDPATDPLGNPPTVGDEYFNTTANLLKRWNGVTWQASDINTANLAAPSGSSLVGHTPAGNGAIPTTVQQQLRNMQGWAINVKDAPYYAKGDGVTDDTVAIQAALNSGAKNVYVPAGVYLVRDVTNTANTPAITVPSGVSIFGDGHGSEIKLMAHSTVEHHVLHLDGVSNVTISWLKINGNRTAQTGVNDEWSHCVAVYNSLNTKITNCFLVSAKGDGVCIAGLTTNGSTGVEVSNCYFDDNYRQCISGVRGSQFRFIGNDFNNTVGVNAPGAAIDLEPNHASDILRHVTISGNNFRNNYYGVIIHDNGPVSHVTIAGNTFDSQRFLDIRCSGRFVSITGNVFKAIGRTASGPAIDVYTASHVSISGNIIEGNYDANERGGIRVMNNVNNITITANTIYKTTGAGINLYPGVQSNAGGLSRAVVTGNVLENCQIELTTGAINISPAATGGDVIDLVLRDNCIYDSRTGGAQPAVGISVSNSTSAMRKTWSIGDNLVRGPTNQTSSFAGMRISGHTQIAEAYLDFDLTSVNDQTLTIAAPGAFTGIPVSLAVPDNAGSINEVWFTAWVSATDVISVRAFKRAGTTPNPPAGYFRASYTTILTT